jgi:hypothetical protein
MVIILVEFTLEQVLLVVADQRQVTRKLERVRNNGIAENCRRLVGTFRCFSLERISICQFAAKLMSYKFFS